MTMVTANEAKRRVNLWAKSRAERLQPKVGEALKEVSSEIIKAADNGRWSMVVTLPNGMGTSDEDSAWLTMRVVEELRSRGFAVSSTVGRNNYRVSWGGDNLSITEESE